MCVAGRRYAGPPMSPRKWRQLRSSQPPSTAGSHSDVRRTSQCWVPQQPSKQATVSQFATPGTTRSYWDVRQ
eukprot:3503773-Pyramimonas_sp.AAC.1